MYVHDRRGVFPRSSSDEVSVLSWNLLAPSYGETALDWESVRLPALRWHLQRFVAFDVMCFQEVDLAHAWQPLCETLALHGFTPVAQERKDYPVVNATFFRSERLRLSWSQHRSRALLVSLLLPDGREIGVANVHLEAGNGAVDLSQREAQLKSVLRRLRERKLSYEVVCGDFNTPLNDEAPLREFLRGYGIAPIGTVGPTHCQGLALDHVCAGANLEAAAVLGSPSNILATMLAEGLPSEENPSDHLPVAALFRVKQQSNQMLPLFEVPTMVDDGMRHEWLEILRAAEVGGGKKSRKQQRRLEEDFLSTVNHDDAVHLRQWRAAAAEAAEVICAMAVNSALTAVRGRGLRFRQCI